MSITINGTTGIAGTNGSASTPAVQGEDTNTGVFFPAADAVAVATGGSERVRVDSSGNVGIGVTPSAWSRKALQIGDAAAAYVANGSGGATVIATNMFFDGSNKYATTAAAARYSVGTGTHEWYTAPSGTAGNAITFTQAMTLDASGNLGVGTSSPSNRLHVQNEITTAYSSSNTLAAAPLAYFYNTNGSVGGAGTIRIDGGTSGGNGAVTLSAVQTASGSSALTFGTRSGGSDVTERARIGSDGVMTIGQTSNINVFSGSADGCSIEGDGAISLSRNQNASLYIRRRSNNGAVAAFLRDTTQVGRIEVTTTATSYVTSSDYRLKENVAPMQNALATIAQLNPVTYTWKADGSAGQGFIAHELQAVVPDCVTGEKDAVDAEGNPQYQGVDTSFLVATLVKAIQELTARVAELEAK